MASPDPDHGADVSGARTEDEVARAATLAKRVARAHVRVVDRIRRTLKAGGRVRVGFFVGDRTKWNGGRLLELFRAHRSYETSLVLVPEGRTPGAGRLTREAYARERVFYARLDPALIDGFDVATETRIDVSALDFDLIFIQQPWGMNRLPRACLGRALCVYGHYGYVVTDNPKLHYGEPDFHPYLWRYLSQSERHRRTHLAHRPELESRLLVAGYPKLDGFARRPDRRLERAFWGDAPVGRRVIYAPHHSIGATNAVRLSTFDWSHAVFAALRDERPEARWAYKPHGNLRFRVTPRKGMSPKAYEAYEDAWERAPNAVVYDDGDYLDLFKTSGLMITDCGSFLGEYMATGKPIIRLISRNGPIPLNETGGAIDAVCYPARTVEDIRALFEMIVLRGEDPLEARRAALRRTLFGRSFDASRAVFHAIRRDVEPPSRWRGLLGMRG